MASDLGRFVLALCALALLQQPFAVLEAVLGAEHRRERKAFMTLLSRDLAADNLHADGCDTSSLQGGEYFTIMAYPHARWESGWGGHTEFAARKCGDAEVEDAALGAATPAVLRVAPLPDRTVAFEGALLHRATDMRQLEHHPELHVLQLEKWVKPLILASCWAVDALIPKS